VHDNPLKSYVLGWLVHSWADPDVVQAAQPAGDGTEFLGVKA
jgi:hypothetical protein